MQRVRVRLIAIGRAVAEDDDVAPCCKAATSAFMSMVWASAQTVKDDSTTTATHGKTRFMKRPLLVCRLLGANLWIEAVRNETHWAWAPGPSHVSFTQW
jgi:hypothetical protein